MICYASPTKTGMIWPLPSSILSRIALASFCVLSTAREQTCVNANVKMLQQQLQTVSLPLSTFASTYSVRLKSPLVPAPLASCDAALCKFNARPVEHRRAPKKGCGWRPDNWAFSPACLRQGTAQLFLLSTDSAGVCTVLTA